MLSTDAEDDPTPPNPTIGRILLRVAALVAAAIYCLLAGAWIGCCVGFGG